MLSRLCIILAFIVLIQGIYINNQTIQADDYPREFESLGEFWDWIDEDDTNLQEYDRVEFNCIDFSLQLQRRALEDGYIVSTEVLPVAAHWVNAVVIDGVVYFVEPQNDRVILSRATRPMRAE